MEVVQEYPTEVEHIYSPSCVPLVRCAGCCGDENLECHPTQTTNVTMQVGRTRALCNIILKAGVGNVGETSMSRLDFKTKKNIPPPPLKTLSKVTPPKQHVNAHCLLTTLALAG